MLKWPRLLRVVSRSADVELAVEESVPVWVVFMVVPVVFMAAPLSVVEDWAKAEPASTAARVRKRVESCILDGVLRVWVCG